MAEHNFVVTLNVCVCTDSAEDAALAVDEIICDFQHSINRSIPENMLNPVEEIYIKSNFDIKETT